MNEETKCIRMIELARTFPALHGKFANAANNGLEPWNVRRLAEASREWSSGEKLVVSFLVSVWNVFEAHEWVEPFNAVDAYCKWDRSNWAAFVAWTKAPFTC